MSTAVDAGGTLARLQALVEAEGEALAPAVRGGGQEVLAPLVLAAAGDRAEAAEYALVVESILEGYLLHFGRPRLVDTEDADLRLLAGDHMYALGLSRLAALGDLPAVRVLADLITLSARHHAEGGVGEELAGAWCRAAVDVVAGTSGGLEAQRALIAFQQVACRVAQT